MEIQLLLEQMATKVVIVHVYPKTLQPRSHTARGGSLSGQTGHDSQHGEQRANEQMSRAEGVDATRVRQGGGPGVSLDSLALRLAGHMVLCCTEYSTVVISSRGPQTPPRGRANG
jgi:hypothetical protein